MAVLLTPPYLQFFDANGVPLAGGKVYTYAAGTTTLKESYTDAEGDTAAANPVVLDSAGRCTLWGTGTYKIRVYDASDNLIEETDDVTAFNATTETTEGFYQSFSGDGELTSFTLDENLGTDEKALTVYGELECVTNGKFSEDSDWTKGTGWSIGSGVATATGAISTNLEQSSAVTLVEGKVYSVIYTITRSAGSITLSLGGVSGTSRNSSGTYTETIIAGATQTISFGTSGFTGTVDDVSIREVGGTKYIPPTFYTVNGTALAFTIPIAEGTNNVSVTAPFSLIGAAGAAQVAADDAIIAKNAAEGATNAVAYRFNFDDTTTMGDPSTGNYRLNDADLTNVTAIALSSESSVSGNPDVSDCIATWGSSNSTNKGQIKISKQGTPATFALYNVTAAVTDNTDWLQITVDHVDSNGTLTDEDICYFQFTRTGDKGDKGDQGDPGTGDVTSTADNDFTGTNTFAGKTGFKDDGILTISSGAVTITGTTHRIAAESGTADDLATINGGSDGEVIFLSVDTGDTITIVTSGNIATQDGEDVEFSDNQKVFLQYNDTLSKWQVVAAPVVGGGGGAWELLGWHSASNDTSVDIGSGLDLDAAIDGTYDEYVVSFNLLRAATGGADLYLRISDDGGATFESTSYRYFGNSGASDSASSANIAGSLATQIRLSGSANGLSSSSARGASGHVRIFSAGQAVRSNIHFDIGYDADSSGEVTAVQGVGQRASASATNALRIFMSSGNITSGQFYLYGIKKS